MLAPHHDSPRTLPGSGCVGQSLQVPGLRGAERAMSLDVATLMAELKRDEGVRLKPYRDTVGKLTIGAGRNLDDKGISAVEATILLANDIEEVCAALDAELAWWRDLDGVRQRAIC